MQKGIPGAKVARIGTSICRGIRSEMRWGDTGQSSKQQVALVISILLLILHYLLKVYFLFFLWYYLDLWLRNVFYSCRTLWHLTLEKKILQLDNRFFESTGAFSVGWGLLGHFFFLSITSSFFSHMKNLDIAGIISALTCPHWVKCVFLAITRA